MFMIMAPSDMPILRDDLTTNFLNNQREVWVELQGKKRGSVYTAFIATNG